MERTNWKGTTLGGTKLHRALIATLRWMPALLVYWFSGVTVVPVCMIVNSSGRLSYRMYRRRFGYNPAKALWWAWRNHYRFSQIVIDRFAMYGGKKFRIDSPDQEIFENLAKGDDGFVMLSAHIGNYELAGYSLITTNKPLNVLVYGGEVATVMDNRENMFGGHNVKMVTTKDDMSHLYEINSALASGEIMSMPGDRIFGSPRHVAATFLGAEAQFPVGPLRVARARGCEVITANVMKSGINRYHIYLSRLDYDRSATPEEQTRQLSSQYVAELERIVRLHPDQWFNFYNFWNE